MQKETKNWYASWFNTPFYHILYKNRDDTEAGKFMTALTKFLKLKKGDTILDAACGKGRHSLFLHKLGYTVTGIDLSEANISAAKEHETNNLNFHVHDIRIPYQEKFNAMFNLFTSFGYFENEADNLLTIKAFKEELKPNGYGVIDFLNVNYVADNLVPNETKIIDGITFNISRKIENGYILKKITFDYDNESYSFVERVRALTLTDFKSYFSKANATLLHTFGNYDLTPFNTETSQRLILIFS